MSRKTKRNAPRTETPPPAAQPPARGRGRAALFIGTAAALLVLFVLGTLIYKSERTDQGLQAAARNLPLLAKDHAPTQGRAEARVHIVEFLDPACETCARFYPLVKRMMAENPDRIRLSVRHVPFHRGADEVVRMIEAARIQGKYWLVLETLLEGQDRWVVNHAAQGEQAWPLISRLGLDLDKLRADMGSPEIARRVEQDLADAKALGVTKTPEFFVNGRPLPSFGLEELRALVREELQRAYR